MTATTHLNDDDLVLHHYGEPGRPDAAEHLEGCPACHQALAQLRRMLEAVDRAPVPEPDPFFASRLWKRLQPRLSALPAPSRWGRWGSMGTARWAAAAAVLLLVMASFVAGLWRGRDAGDASIPEEIRQRVLQVAVADHLERSELLLTELLNGTNGSGAGPAARPEPSGIPVRRQRAEALVAAGRIYRQTAAAAGDAGLTAVLGDLERVLLEVSHAEDSSDGPGLEGLRKQVESSGILFKVRVMSRHLRGPRPPAPSDRLDRAGRRT